MGEHSVSASSRARTVDFGMGGMRSNHYATSPHCNYYLENPNALILQHFDSSSVYTNFIRNLALGQALKVS